MTASQGQEQGIRAVPWRAEARARAVQKRTIRLLSAAQIVGGIGIGVSVSNGSLLAESVAHNETYAGLARTARWRPRCICPG
ncbi:hypothetical protein GCM10015535_37460 [Streptomyces gelaticus]|uniref:Uncharacterized protein n=1 Tax=Streptomyces gelaticus TaxID=285446 RepID=A0ABQ2W072_9ACTN|nr:hypothetical protein [Streptomyces gelaticus]GGV87719.1 hypothetical protein GCM10015535_37460 [Streptomyces gelaticus]